MYKIRNKGLYSILIIFVWLSTFGFYILYGHRYNDWYRRIPLALLLVGYVLLYLMWVNDTDRDVPGWMKNVLRFVATMAAVGLFFLVVTLNQKYCAAQLAKYTVNVSAIVTKIDIREFKGNKSYYDILQYGYQNKVYMQKLHDDKHIYKQGDTVAFICSSHDPQIIKVAGFAN